MRIISLAATAILALGTAAAAQAAPAMVDVTIGPQLQAKAEKTYGVRDVRELAEELRAKVERQLARTGAYDGARIDLVLTEATPNHPTFKQLSDTPGLSMRSFGLGGARIEGKIVAADGRETPINYHYEQTDIRQARATGTWSDAEWTLSQFAYQLARGKVMARR